MLEGMPHLQSVIGVAFAGMLLTYAQKRRGAEHIEDAIELLNEDFTKAQIIRLRGPKVETETLEMMSRASAFLASILAVADAREARRKKVIRRSLAGRAEA